MDVMYMAPPFQGFLYIKILNLSTYSDAVYRTPSTLLPESRCHPLFGRQALISPDPYMISDCSLAHTRVDTYMRQDERAARALNTKPIYIDALFIELLLGFNHGSNISQILILSWPASLGKTSSWPFLRHHDCDLCSFIGHDVLHID